VAECAARAGRWPDAERAAVEGLSLARELGLENIAAHELAVLARIEAARGDRQRCFEHASEALVVLESSEMHLPATQVRCTLGLLELGLDDTGRALEALEPAAVAVAKMGLVDPDVCPVPDLVEALVRLGRRDDARDALDEWRSSAPQEAPWLRARVARCEGLVADEDAFEERLAAAVELDTGADPFALARTLLCYGERLRRVGRRVDARRQLRSALRTFEDLRATPWVERASRELRATGEKIGRRRAEPGDELTAQEMQIALQVAEGKQNKEVAAALFLSPKTIEFHLGRVYRKLDINSRTELVRRFAMDGVASAT
jgi:DNA-binding CsgD family transcriptional regulator